jgi:hypothetical protein
VPNDGESIPVGLGEKDLEAPVYFSCFCDDLFRSGEVSYVFVFWCFGFAFEPIERQSRSSTATDSQTGQTCTRALNAPHYFG